MFLIKSNSKVFSSITIKFSLKMTFNFVISPLPELNEITTETARETVCSCLDNRNRFWPERRGCATQTRGII